jgi:hypothetical protein
MLLFNPPGEAKRLSLDRFVKFLKEDLPAFVKKNASVRRALEKYGFSPPTPAFERPATLPDQAARSRIIDSVINWGPPVLVHVEKTLFGRDQNGLAAAQHMIAYNKLIKVGPAAWVIHFPGGVRLSPPDNRQRRLVPLPWASPIYVYEPFVVRWQQVVNASSGNPDALLLHRLLIASLLHEVLHIIHFEVFPDTRALRDSQGQWRIGPELPKDHFFNTFHREAFGALGWKDEEHMPDAGVLRDNGVAL